WAGSFSASRGGSRSRWAFPLRWEPKTRCIAWSDAMRCEKLFLSERDRLHLQEMVDAIDEMALQVAGVEQDAWIEDRTRVAATSMYLIVLGEGAQNLSTELKAHAPDIPWSDIAGLRHRLAHSYFRADRRIIWNAASGPAQSLKPVLQTLL